MRFKRLFSALLSVSMLSSVFAAVSVSAHQEKNSTASEKITYDVYGIEKYKAFFWEDLSSLKPICASYENK